MPPPLDPNNDGVRECRAKNWCFTMNNYSEEDVDRLSAPLEDVLYIVFGREVGGQGTPHLQGTVCFSARKRLPQVIAIIGQAHFTVTRLLPQSVEYCKKDGNFVEKGTMPRTTAGKRNDLENFKDAVKDGMYDKKDLRENFSEICAAYPQFVENYIRDNKPKITVQPYPLREWQADLHSKLILEPDPREILFVVDRNGNQGKSWFARYYCDLHDNAQIIIPGKKADMAYVVEEDKKVFFFDCPRSKQGDFIQYDFLEELKNGYIFSPKYQSLCKKLKTPHVVVLMNEMPDMEKLSRDRITITLLE